MTKALRALVLLLTGVSGLWAAGLNKEMGVDLWTSPSLWTQDALATAQKLKMKTTGQGASAYYEKDFSESAKVLGARARTLHVYSQNGKISQVIVNFVNQADLYNEISKKKENKGKSEGEIMLEVQKALKSELDASYKAVNQALGYRLGTPKQAAVGQNSWSDSIHEYILRSGSSGLSLTIQPASGNSGEAAATTAAREDRERRDAMQRVKQSAQHRSNGDVVIGGIPQVSQGDRNYCVPATWEKYLRYYGMNMDVYQLAESGGTQVGGSNYLDFTAKIGASLDSKGYEVEYVKGSPDNLSVVQKYINAGMPLIWPMDSQYMGAWLERSKKRINNRLPNDKSTVKKGEEAPHVVMVIGYNAGTRELALSDSTEFGSGTPEIWIRVEDVEVAASKQDMVALKFKSAAPGTSVAPNTAPGGKKWY